MPNSMSQFTRGISIDIPSKSIDIFDMILIYAEPLSKISNQFIHFLTLSYIHERELIMPWLQFLLDFYQDQNNHIL